MANIEALEETLAFIEAHPEQHDQSEWGRKTECGTTACFAGTRMLLTGRAEYREFPGSPVRDLCMTDGGSFFDVAQEDFDLTYGQATALFLSAQDLVDVRAVIENIKSGDTYEYDEDSDDDYDYDDYGFGSES